MGTLRELDALKGIVEVQKKEISDLKQEILDIKKVVSELIKKININ